MENNALLTESLRRETKSFVYCPECGRVLYEMPVSRNKIDMIRFRVVLNTIEGHCDFYSREHDPILINRPDGKYIQTEEDFGSNK